MCAELVRLGGLSRLLELCKEPMERNYSDAVLVACLAVLRRVRQQQNNLNMDREERLTLGEEAMEQLLSGKYRYCPNLMYQLTNQFIHEEGQFVSSRFTKT